MQNSREFFLFFCGAWLFSAKTSPLQDMPLVWYLRGSAFRLHSSGRAAHSRRNGLSPAPPAPAALVSANFFFCKAMHFMGFPKDLCAPMPTGSIKKHGRHCRGVRSTLQSNGAGRAPRNPGSATQMAPDGSGENCGL